MATVYDLSGCACCGGAGLVTSCGCKITSSTATATLNINGTVFTFPMTLTVGGPVQFQYSVTGLLCGGPEDFLISLVCSNPGGSGDLNSEVTINLNGGTTYSFFDFQTVASATFVCSPFYWDVSGSFLDFTYPGGTVCGATFNTYPASTPYRLTIVTP